MLSVSARLEALAFRAALGLPPSVVRRLAGRPVVRDGQTLDPQTQWMLRLQQLVHEPPVGSLTVEEGRRAMLRQARLAGGRPRIGAVRDLEVPTPGGSQRARLYSPSEPAPGDGLLVFFHGGGMIYGDLDSHDAPCRVIAERSGVSVLSLEYRLAPEHRFPAGVEDAWAGYEWVVEHADELGADPDRVGVGGDSAGGYLAAVVARRAAETGTACCFQLLVYPVTDHVGPSASRDLFADGFYLDRAFMDLALSSYASVGTDLADPLLSVAYAEKVPDGLARALVVTAGFDPLRDEGEAYARTLGAAGVEVDLQRYPGFIHGFLNICGVGRSTREAVLEIADRVRAAMVDA